MQKVEMNLIALLIQKPALIFDVNNIIKSIDFSDNQIKAIFNYIDSNADATYSDLENNRLINTDNYNLYTANIRDKNIVKLAKQLKRNSVLKRYKDFVKITDIEIDNQTDIYDYLDSVNNKISEIKECTVPDSIKSGLDIFDGLEAFLKHSNANALHTHYPMLDRILGNIDSTDLVVIAARPAMGKTAFAMNLMYNLGRFSKCRVGLINLEMSNEQILLRLIAKITNNELKDIRDNFANLKQTPDFTSKIAKALKKIDYLTSDSWQCKIADIKRIVRRFKRLGCKCIIIDYLGLINPPKAENRNNEISVIVRDLKMLCKEVEMPIFLLSQLNRSVENRVVKVPMLSDIRDSGSVEQDADKILFLYRGEAYKERFCSDKMTDSTNKIEIIVAKNRQGEVGSCILECDLSKMNITDSIVD